jgi:hypothetical protein
MQAFLERLQVDKGYVLTGEESINTMNMDQFTGHLKLVLMRFMVQFVINGKTWAGKLVS